MAADIAESTHEHDHPTPPFRLRRYLLTHYGECQPKQGSFKTFQLPANLAMTYDPDGTKFRLYPDRTIRRANVKFSDAPILADMATKEIFTDRFGKPKA